MRDSLRSKQARTPEVIVTSTINPPIIDQLYVIYMESSVLFFQQFEPQSVERRSPRRDTDNCPDWAYGFYYAIGPEEVTKISQLDIVSGMYFVDAIIIPTARLTEYCAVTGVADIAEGILRNSEGATHHAHGRNNRFYRFDMQKDEQMSTQRAKR